MFLQAVYTSPLWVQACFLALLLIYFSGKFFFPLLLTCISYHTQNRANLESSGERSFNFAPSPAAADELLGFVNICSRLRLVET